MVLSAPSRTITRPTDRIAPSRVTVRPRSHTGAVAACYLGLSLIVALAVLLEHLISSSIAATLTVVLIGALVLWLHPTLARRGRRRISRHT